MSKSLYKLRVTPWYLRKGATTVCVQIGSSTLASLWTDGRARGKSSTSYELVPDHSRRALDQHGAQPASRAALAPSERGKAPKRGGVSPRRSVRGCVGTPVRALWAPDSGFSPRADKD